MSKWCNACHPELDTFRRHDRVSPLASLLSWTPKNVSRDLLLDLNSICRHHRFEDEPRSVWTFQRA